MRGRGIALPRVTDIDRFAEIGPDIADEIPLRVPTYFSGVGSACISLRAAAREDWPQSWKRPSRQHKFAAPAGPALTAFGLWVVIATLEPWQLTEGQGLRCLRSNAEWIFR